MIKVRNDDMSLENIQSDVEKIAGEYRLMLAKDSAIKEEDKIKIARSLLKTYSIDKICSELNLTEKDLNYMEEYDGCDIGELINLVNEKLGFLSIGGFYLLSAYPSRIFCSGLYLVTEDNSVINISVDTARTKMNMNYPKLIAKIQEMNQYCFSELTRSAGYVGVEREAAIKKIEIYKVEKINKFEKLIEPRLLVFTLSDETKFALGWDWSRNTLFFTLIQSEISNFMSLYNSSEVEVFQ
jgi:DNA-binding protein Fis